MFFIVLLVRFKQGQHTYLKNGIHILVPICLEGIKNMQRIFISQTILFVLIDMYFGNMTDSTNRMGMLAFSD